VEFQVGEKVIYPNHGIGVVESIQTRPVPGGKISLYQLRILANDSRVWVPQQNADGVGLRPVIRPAEVRKIFTLLGDGRIEQVANWKGRFKENSDKMRTGSLYEVAVVLKGLTFLSRKKALSFREKRMLERAKFLLISEIAEAEDKTRTAVEERVDKALEDLRRGGRQADAEASGSGPTAGQRLISRAARRIPRAFLDFGEFAALESAVLRPSGGAANGALVTWSSRLEPQ
jgi:CarD family transcriptional regulator